MRVTGSARHRLVDRLRAAGCVAAEEEAGELLDAAPTSEMLETWVVRREGGEPLAWIIGRIRFCGRALHVDTGVYVPRSQSEELVGRALSRLGRGRAADLCTGSGAVAAALQAGAPGATVVGTDLDPRSVECARRNGVRVVLGDLAEPLADRSFDVVTAIAPYVPTGDLGLLPRDVTGFEPRRALDGGRDGLDVLRRIVTSAARVLRPGGGLFVEVGGEQDRLLSPVLEAAGFARPEPWYDDDGDLRGLMAGLA